MRRRPHRRQRSVPEQEESMWQRLSRVMRSFIGFFISAAEDPEIILQQNIRDMNDQVPRMNESIAMVKANVTLLEREEVASPEHISRQIRRWQSSHRLRSINNT